jgi:anthranilate/para-aminobenzoate synthase component I
LRIHRAIKCLKIEPEQDGVVNHIQVLLTTTLVTRDQMIAVYLAYSGPNNPHHKLYEMMVQTTAYKIVNDDKVKPGQKKQLFEASQTQPDLFAALNTKIEQLKASKKFRLLDDEAKQGVKEAKRDNRKERRKAEQEKKRRASQEGKVARRLAREEFERAQAEAWKEITEGVEGL